MRIRSLVLLVLVATVLVPVVGCGRLNSTASTPVADRKLTTEALRALQPVFRKGRTWTYLTTMADAAGKPRSIEQTLKVVAISDGAAKLEVATEGLPTQTTTVPTGEGASAMPAPRIDSRTMVVNEGTEDLVVGAGTFKNATRVAISSSASFEAFDPSGDEEEATIGGPSSGDEADDDGEAEVMAVARAVPGMMSAASVPGTFTASAKKGFGTLTLTVKATMWLVPTLGTVRCNMSLSGGGKTTSAKIELKAYKP